MAYFEKTTIEYPQNSPFVNPSGLLKVTNTVEHFSIKASYDELLPFWLVLNNTNGTVSYNATSNQRKLSIGSGASDILRTQSTQAFVYLPGNVHRFTSTIEYSLQTGAELSYGLFDNDNGFFFTISRPNNDYAISVTRRSKSSGSIVNETITQSNWNLDKLNGTGPSKVSLDLTKVQTLVIETSWAGGDSVSFGFEIDRKVYYIHSISASNNLSNFITGDPDLPIRCEIKNNSSTSGNSYIGIGGVFLGIDGSFEQRKGFNRGKLAAPRNVYSGVTYPLLSIRPKTTFKGKTNRCYCRPEDFSFYGTADGYYSLLYDATLTGASWNDVDVNASMMQFDASATAVSGGTTLYVGGLNTGQGGGDRKETFNTKDVLTANSDGSGSHTLTLAFTSTANGVMGASFNWLEYY